MSLSVDVISDVICPWCYIGKRRLEKAIQDAVVEALFRAYFTEGQDIGNRQTLIEVVTEAGLDRQAVETMLDCDEGIGVIVKSREMSQQFGVDGVPFFIINQKITLAGAQDSETFLEAFHNA